MRVFVAHPFSQREEGYRQVLQRAAEGTGIEFDYADSRIENKHVLEIRTQMADADLCLFDLKGSNPNVTLELGIAIEAEHPACLVLPEAEASKVIADLGGWDSIRYRDYADLASQLVAKVKANAFARRATTSSLPDTQQYLKETNYGLQGGDNPEASVLIVPLPLRIERLPEDFLEDRGNAISSTIGNFINETRQQHQLAHFFHLRGTSFEPDRRYGFFEFYEAGSNGPLWSIRVYLSGMIVYRTPIMYHGALGIDQYREYVLGTCVFADKLLNHLKVEVREICVVSRLVNLGDGTLGVAGPLGQGAQVKLKQPAPNGIQVPRRLRTSPRDAISPANAPNVADKFKAELREWFEKNLDRFL